MSNNKIRQQVFEVVVRQALAGAPWREICEGPMKANGIHPSEVEKEVARRKALGFAKNPGSLLIVLVVLAVAVAIGIAVVLLK